MPYYNICPHCGSHLDPGDAPTEDYFWCKGAHFSSLEG